MSHVKFVNVLGIRHLALYLALCLKSTSLRPSHLSPETNPLALQVLLIFSLSLCSVHYRLSHIAYRL